MTSQKRVEGRTARLEWLLDNEIHLFHGMVGAIGNPTGFGTLLSPKTWKIERFVLLSWNWILGMMCELVSRNRMIESAGRSMWFDVACNSDGFL